MTEMQMMSRNSLLESREERIARAMKFNLLSDVFMSVALRDIPACQHVLRTVTGISDLVVKEVRTQYTIAKVVSHGARLDVLAEDEAKKIYNIEIQRSDIIDHPRRVRFYGSVIDSEILEKGAEYDQLPEVHVIYISEKDIWKGGKAVYQVEKRLDGIEEIYDDGIHILYINAQVKDGTKIAELMKYFKTADPEDMSQGDLSKRVHFLKCEEEGVKIMCEVTESFVQAGMQAGVKAMIETCRDLGVAREDTVSRLRKKLSFTEEEAEQYMKEYWEETEIKEVMI